jgi:hypothetical protein
MAVAFSDTRLRGVFAAAGATVGSSNIVAIGIANHSPAVRNVASPGSRIAIGSNPGRRTICIAFGHGFGLGISAGGAAVTKGNSILRAVFAAARSAEGGADVVAIGVADHGPAIGLVASVCTRVAVGSDPSWRATITFGYDLGLMTPSTTAELISTSGRCREEVSNLRLARLVAILAVVLTTIGEAIVVAVLVAIHGPSIGNIASPPSGVAIGTNPGMC